MVNSLSTFADSYEVDLPLWFLAVLGRAIKTGQFMGWSSTAMAARYQHITDPIRRDIAKRVGGLLWAPGDDRGRPDGDEPEDGAAGVLASA